MTALKVESVKKSFKSGKSIVCAVDGASLTVDDGEIVGLLGMNGAGKSTLIKMCTGLLAPDEGRITVFGHDVATETAAAKSFINISPQETAVAMSLTVKENLVFISRIYGADKAEADKNAEAVIERLRLTDKANAAASKLSGGLMRRLSIGMALITRPKLVFLDEPTLGLDVVARRELWKLINDIKADTAVMLTTHYLDEAKSLCDRIAVMARGKIVAVGTLDELYALSGNTDFEQAFLKLAGEEVDDE